MNDADRIISYGKFVSQHPRRHGKLTTLIYGHTIWDLFYSILVVLIIPTLIMALIALVVIGVFHMINILILPY